MLQMPALRFSQLRRADAHFKLARDNLHTRAISDGGAMAGRRLKNFVFGTLTIVLSVAFTLLLAEASAIAYLTMRDGKYVSAHQRFENADHPWFQGTIERPTDTYYCKHVDTLFPHPYLGWVYHGNPPCGYPSSINNVGTQR